MPHSQCQYCLAPTEDHSDTCDDCTAADAIAYQALRNDLDATELDGAIAQTVAVGRAR